MSEDNNATSKTNTPVGNEEGNSDAPNKAPANAPGAGTAGGPALDGPETDPNRANAEGAANDAADKLND